MASKIKGLQQWCSRRTEGYKDVNVTDMSSSWRDGLAFCAIIHRFRPDLIDFDSLSKENILENNQLAFEVAEQELDIPAFLDAPDMVRMKKPDKLSIITYVSQYYNYFHDKPELGGPGVRKPGARTCNSIKTADDTSKKTTFKEQNGVASNKSKTATMGDKCTICDGKVYLLERHVENNKLYHRLCFRHSAMSPTNKVYKSGSKNEDNTSASKVRKLDHKANGDAMFGRNSGKKSLFSEEKNNGVSLLSYSSNASQAASKTPSKYHQHAMEFLAGDNVNENSSFNDKTKSFATSTPKSKYEDKTSLTVVSSTSQNGVKTSYSDSPPKWSSDKDNVQLTKFSLQADKNKTPERKSSDVIETRAREMRKLLEEKSRDQKVETPKSGLRDFLKKYHEQGDTEKENKSVSASTSKTFEKMDVDTSSPQMHKKDLHNSNPTDKKEEKTLKPWESHHRRTNDSKSSFTPIKTNDNKTGVMDYKSVLNKSKQDSSLNNTKEDNKVTKNPVLNSYKSSLDKLKEKDTGVDKLKKDSKHNNGTSYLFGSKSSDERSAAKSEVSTSYLSKSGALPDKDSGRKSPLYTKKTESKSKNNVDSKYTKDSYLDSSKTDMNVNSTKSDLKVNSTKSDIKLNFTKDTDLSCSSRFYKDSSDKKESEKRVVSPVPKPRGILKQTRHEEDMEVSDKQSVKTSISLTPSAAPRSIQNITKIGKLNDEVSKTKSPMRPKSPVLSNVKFSSSVKEDKVSEAPPPLPVSPPPRVTVASSSAALSQPKTTPYSSSKFSEMAPPLPRKSYKDKDDHSPPLPPRNTLKVVSQDTHVIGQSEGPPKPPRLTWRQESQMSVDEALHKAMNPETSPEPVAVLVSPSDSSNSNILGGLLKSLAGVRQNSPTEKSSKNFSQSNDPLNIKDKELEITLRRGGKELNPNTSAPVLNLANRNNKDRPKSVSSVLDNYNNNKRHDEDRPSWRTQKDIPEDDRNTRRPKSVTNLEDDGPSVKWSLEQKKNEKPKSTHNNTNDGMLTWQREAAKRMAKNRDFVDPEFEKKTGKKVPEERKSNLNDTDLEKTENRRLPDTPRSPVALKKVVDKPVSPVDNRQAPIRPPRTRPLPSPPNNNSTSYLVDRKNETNKYNGLSSLSQPVLPSSPSLRKITPNIKFDFDKSSEFENSMDLSNKNLQFESKLTTPKPPPLKVDISPRRYSPVEIRSNLDDIDNKLTELELRGRQLEDTIRNATTSEVEDELLNEWFKLINEKNELVRQEADLIYINKEQELEDEQESIDSRLRYLMALPENDKTLDEREEEEELIDKKLEIINMRSTIVDSIDEDRLRYEEEDREISNVLQAKGFDLSGSVQKGNDISSKKKKK